MRKRKSWAFWAVAVAGVALIVMGPSLPRAWHKIDRLRRRLKEQPVIAMPAEGVTVKEGFRLELVYAVPRGEEHHSWVRLCVDPKGRLIASDEGGRLYRMTPPAVGAPPGNAAPEMLPVDLGEAQGLVWAAGGLYVVVNHFAHYESGLWRVFSTKNDDVLDGKEKLHGFEDLGFAQEHGPHAVLLAPDGKSLFVFCGNSTKLTRTTASDMPRLGEDFLLPRMEDPKGLFAGAKPPGGCIYQTDLDGKNWKLISGGHRNTYGGAFDSEGELFTADNDMEWDFNLPWYRPTRVVHAVPGSDFGWRSGSGKEYESYPDSLPAAINIGPGAPSGIAFGYRARLPARYQKALFVCDWSSGKLYAVHLTPHGSSYGGELEEVLSGAPLPLADIVVNPMDGAIYLITGGRGTTSALYRLTYAGTDPTGPATALPAGADARAVRRDLEALYDTHDSAAAIALAWPNLGSDDRFIRYAARTVLEIQPPNLWQERAISEPDPAKLIYALLGLARAGDPSLEPRLLEAMERVEWRDLTDPAKIDYLRTYQVILARMGRPSPQWQARLAARLNEWFPSQSPQIDAELCRLLSYFNDPRVVSKSLALLARAPSPQEQVEYVASLRMVKTGWSIAQRRAYFEWFRKAISYGGGQSFHGYLALIRADAIDALPQADRAELRPLLDLPVVAAAPMISAEARPFVKVWTVAELYPQVETGMTGRDFARGHRLFAEAGCFACHRFNNEGGSVGPDLSAVGGRFGTHDLLESIIEPSKVIADQYADQIISTVDGDRLVGRIIGGTGDSLYISTNMLDPGQITIIERKQVKSIELSKVSPMPSGLLDHLQRDEILDLVAYLRSRGDPTAPMFSRSSGAAR